MKKYWILYIILIVMASIELSVIFESGHFFSKDYEFEYAVGQDLEPGLYTVELDGMVDLEVYNDIEKEDYGYFVLIDNKMVNLELTEGQVVTGFIPNGAGISDGTEIFTKQSERIKFNEKQPENGMYLAGEDFPSGLTEVDVVGGDDLNVVDGNAGDNSDGSYEMNGFELLDDTEFCELATTTVDFEPGMYLYYDANNFEECDDTSMIKPAAKSVKEDKLTYPKFKNQNVDLITDQSVTVGEDIPAGMYQIEMAGSDDEYSEFQFYPRHSSVLSPNYTSDEFTYMTLYDGDVLKPTGHVKFTSIDKYPKITKDTDDEVYEYIGGQSIDVGKKTVQDGQKVRIIRHSKAGYATSETYRNHSDEKAEEYQVNPGDIVIVEY